MKPPNTVHDISANSSRAGAPTQRANDSIQIGSASQIPNERANSSPMKNHAPRDRSSKRSVDSEPLRRQFVTHRWPRRSPQLRRKTTPKNTIAQARAVGSPSPGSCVLVSRKMAIGKPASNASKRGRDLATQSAKHAELHSPTRSGSKRFP